MHNTVMQLYLFIIYIVILCLIQAVMGTVHFSFTLKGIKENYGHGPKYKKHKPCFLNGLIIHQSLLRHKLAYSGGFQSLNCP